MNNQKIKVSKNGPYLVSGKIPLAKEIAIGNANNGPTDWVREEEMEVLENYALCRCGHSRNKPFCDGTHQKIYFVALDIIDQQLFTEKASKIVGPELDLYDYQKLCSGARFCHLGQSTWNDVINSNNLEAKQNAIRSACNCPSGRLVVVDKQTGKMIEPDYQPVIGITEDPLAGVSGPLAVKGNIEIETSDGEKYETRNRVTLCRCGLSKNDGDKSLKPKRNNE